jgi:hypothetical protein
MLRRVAALYALVVLTSIGMSFAQTTDTVTMQTTDRITVSGRSSRSAPARWS